MRRTKLLCVLTLTLTFTATYRIAAQVQTEVPPAVLGAKPVSVEHIKVHGTALDAIWRVMRLTAT